MPANVFHRALYLTGPTASGKTGIGIELARLLDAEIIALDSMTLYRGMDVGTAKPTLDERRGVPHHLIDVLDPWQASSVADYRNWAEVAALAVEARGRRVLFVGGTPMYLKVLLRGLFAGPPAEPALRLRLNDEADRLGNATLHSRLAAVDPPTAARLHPNDRRRVIRALEVHELTGRPLSSLQAEHDRPAPESTTVLALDRPRERLHQSIDERVDRMIRDGWIDEVRRLIELPHPLDAVPAQALGYGELIDHLRQPDHPDLAAAITRIKHRTRQFAKRQATWFRGLAEVRSWPVPDGQSPIDTAQRLARHVGQ